MQFITSTEFAALHPTERYCKEHKMVRDVCDANENTHLVFYKQLFIDSNQTFFAYISADDYYKLYINGRLVCMGPAPSNPTHQSYNRIELTELFELGENLITVHVFYQGLLNRALYSTDNRCAFGFELYADGKLLLNSDGSWRYNYDRHYVSGGTLGYKTAFLENLDFTLYDDRIYDGRAEGEKAVAVDFGYTMADEPAECVALEHIKPMLIKHISENEIFVDMGKEYVGYPCFTMHGARGQRLRLLLGEETAENNSMRARHDMRCNCNYDEMLTLSGGVDQADFFDYKAFRYMTFECEDIENTIDIKSISVLARHARYSNCGAHLKSAEPLVCDIWELCEHTAHYATQEGFLDCPTREKGQYLGDFTVSGLAHMYLSGDSYMYRKTLYDFAASADICRGLMAVSPGAFMQEIADFSLQYPLQLYNYYEYTGDDSTARELFCIADGILEYFSRYERDDGLLVGVYDKWNIVDWPENLRDGYDYPLTRPISADSFHNVINAYYVGAHIYVERLADALGIDHLHRSLALAKTFNDVFYNKKTGLYRDASSTEHSSLHSNALPAFFGFEKKESRENIKRLIADKGLSCGVQFSYFVLGACAALGEYELEYSFITNKGEHSWYNMLREGATTLFEAWGKEQKWNTSLCHPWASAPIIALCRDYLGMRECGIDIEIEFKRKK